MKNLLIAAFLSLLAVGFTAGNAEAARLGGGKSFGMQRQVTPRPAPAPSRQAVPAPAPTPSPAAPAPAAPKRSWLGPLAGLAAGLGIAGLLSHFGLGGAFADLLMIALFAMAAVFILRRLTGRKADNASPMQYAGGVPRQEPAPLAPPIAAPPSGAEPLAAASIPAGFDREGFLRVAKLNFVRLQAANDAGDLDDIREFLAPEVFAEVKMQLDERGRTPQQTDIVTLDAELLEVLTEGARYIASVHFSGMIRETAGAAAVPFSEIWHLSKPVAGGGWTVAGIHQLS